MAKAVPVARFVPFTGYDPCDGDDPRVTSDNPLFLNLFHDHLSSFERAAEDPASPMWAAPDDEGSEFDPEDCPNG